MTDIFDLAAKPVEVPALTPPSGDIFDQVASVPESKPITIFGPPKPTPDQAARPISIFGPKPETYEPGVPKPELPGELRPTPLSRPRQSLTGSEEPKRTILQQVGDLAAGTAKYSSGALIPAAILDPAGTAVALGVGYGAQKGGEELATKAGASPETAKAIGNIAGYAGGAALGLSKYGWGKFFDVLESSSAQAEAALASEQAAGRAGVESSFIGQKVTGPEGIPVEIGGKPYTVKAGEPSFSPGSAPSSQRPVYNVVDADGKVVRSGSGPQVSDYLGQQGAKPAAGAPKEATSAALDQHYHEIVIERAEAQSAVDTAKNHGKRDLFAESVVKDADDRLSAVQKQRAQFGAPGTQLPKSESAPDIFDSAAAPTVSAKDLVPDAEFTVPNGTAKVIGVKAGFVRYENQNGAPRTVSVKTFLGMATPAVPAPATPATPAAAPITPTEQPAPAAAPAITPLTPEQNVPAPPISGQGERNKLHLQALEEATPTEVNSSATSNATSVLPGGNELAGVQPSQAVPVVPEGNGQEPVRGSGPAVSGSTQGEPEPVAGSESELARRVTGSTESELTPRGIEQGHELKAKAELADKVLTAPNDRAEEFGKLVNLEAERADWLQPWYLGENEGRPLEEARDDIHNLITDKPDKKPGVSAYSGQPGESFNTVRKRLIGGVQKQAEDMATGFNGEYAGPEHLTVLNITSGRALQIVDAWAKAGKPADRSVDESAMTADKEFSKPGDLFKLEDDGLKPVAKIDGPGQYFAQHGETNWNQSAPEAEQPVETDSFTVAAREYQRKRDDIQRQVESADNSLTPADVQKVTDRLVAKRLGAPPKPEDFAAPEAPKDVFDQAAEEPTVTEQVSAAIHGTWMNRFDIEEALDRYKKQPESVLGRATKFLHDFMEQVDSNSDGWPYWRLPAHAAQRLEALIQNPETATEKNLRAALAPIRAFYTRRGLDAGMKFPEITLAAPVKAGKKVVTPQIPTGVAGATPLGVAPKPVTIEAKENEPATQSTAEAQQSTGGLDRQALDEQLPERSEGVEEPESTPAVGRESSGERGAGPRAGAEPGTELERGPGTVSGVVGDAAEPEVTFPPRGSSPTSTSHDGDYRIPDGRVVSGSPEKRARVNIDAIAKLREIQSENRPATIEEQKILAGYVGWGAVPQLFAGLTSEWQNLQSQLKNLVSEQEYAEAQRSTTNAHYTGDNVVDAMWRAMIHIGATPGMSWLEPAIGTGNFFGRQPDSLLDGARRMGVEKDALTGAIARLLYPDSGIDIMPFERAELPENYFDAAISNVPFGNFGVHDPAMKKFLTSSIHNYFFAKALTMVRPGGVVGFVTSRYTLDAFAPAAVEFRKWVAERADFLGAVRLPSGAFRQNAGTDVITDIIFLRKRLPGREGEANRLGHEWIKSKSKQISTGYYDKIGIPVNEYYHANPEQILGTEGVARGQFSANDYDVKGVLTDEALNTALRNLGDNQFLEFKPSKATRTRAIRELNAPAEQSKLGGLFFDDKGQLFRKTSKGSAEPVDISGQNKVRIKGQLLIRNELARLMDAERNPAVTDEEITKARKRLNAAYDHYVKTHGFLSARANTSVMAGDPDAPLLVSLERRYNQGNKAQGVNSSAEKSPIMSRRMFNPEKPITSASDPKDALYVSLNETGRIDWERMAALSGKMPEQLQKDLAGLVYIDPRTNTWQTADEYLSGSVRTKLREARAIAKLEPGKWNDNVAALEGAQPEDIPPGEIRAALGITWVPLPTYGEFVQDVLGIDIPVPVTYIAGNWNFEVPWNAKRKSASAEKWNTARVGAARLLNDSLNMKRTKVYDESKDGSSLNVDETRAAQNKQDELQKYFNEWLFADSARGDKMTRIYNELNNDLRLWQADGSHLTLPGMVRDTAIVRTGDLEPHQKNAVWRVIKQKNVLLAHAVGTGKAQPLDAKLATPTGWSRMGDLTVGDMVIAGDGTPTMVEAVFPQGEKEIFRIEFSDGSSTECCDEHLWLTRTYAERNAHSAGKRMGRHWPSAQPKIRSLAEICETLVADHLEAKNHSIPMAGPVQFSARPVPLDPYLIGALLGDGCFRGSGTVTISCAEPELLEMIISALPAGCEIRHRSGYDYAICQTCEMKQAVNGYARSHPIVSHLKSLGIYGKYAQEKHVPAEYLYNSIEVRTAVLHGLMDTDGTVDKNGTQVSFTTTSAKLRDAMRFLVQSLGGTVGESCKRPIFTHRGVRKIGLLAYTLSICLPPSVQPFRLRRKVKAVKPKTKYVPIRFVTAVVPVGKKLAQCIRVAHPSHLYLTDDFIVTHNTFEAIAAGMELKRLGLVQRPMYVVPNDTLGGWQLQFNALYPQARTLVFSEKDLEKNKRQRVMAQIATGDWDAVIVPHSSFQFLATGDKIFQAHFEKLAAELDEQIAEANGAGLDSRQIKRMEKAKERLLKSLEDKRKEEKKDQTVTWEQLGIDQLFVDESHEYKKLGFATKQGNVAGIDQNGNQKTFDLLMKLRYTQTHGRGVVFLTGTPITNTMGEMFNLMKYLIEPELEARGIGKFDEWAANYGRTVDVFEPKAEGGGYQMKARFAKFVNLPELIQLFRSFTDVVTPDMVKLPVPEIIGGNRQAVITELTPEQASYLENDLRPRAAGIRRDPRGSLPDNMLSVYTDAGKMAMDVRMVDPTSPGDPEGRLAKAATRIHGFWKESSKEKGTQAIFADVGKPAWAGGSPDFSAYDDLIDKLVALGIPRNQIATIYEAKNKTQRRQLFEKFNDGKIRVMLGSTKKMGQGVNIQERLYALHHIDIPARPDQLEQREGRILRQGNKNPAVHILYYMTKGSLDEAKFANVVRKGKFISSAMQGKTTVREAEDIGGMIPSLEMFQAMTSGDPRVLRKMEVDAELDRLSSVRSGWKNQLWRARGELSTIPAIIKRESRMVEQLKEAIATRDATGRVFEVNGKRFEGEGISDEVSNRLYAAADKVRPLEERKIKGWDGKEQVVLERPVIDEPVKIGTAYGVPVYLRSGGGPGYQIGEDDLAEASIGEPNDKKGTFARIQNAVTGLDKKITKHQDVIDTQIKNQVEYRKFVETPWPYESDYESLVKEQGELVKALGGDKGDDAAMAAEAGQEVSDSKVEAEERSPAEEDDEGEDEAGPEENAEGPVSNRLGSRAGRSPALDDLITKLASIGKSEEPAEVQGQRHYSRAAAGRRMILPGRNLEEVKAASSEVYAAAVRSGAAASTASAIMHNALPQIRKELEASKTGITVHELFAAYQESRLRAISARYQRWADAMNVADDEEVQKAVNQSLPGGRSSMLDMFEELDDKLPDLDLKQTAMMLVRGEDWHELGQLVDYAFSYAAQDVTHTLDDAKYDQIVKAIHDNPRVRTADSIYHDQVESEVAEAHELHDGVFAEDLGTLNRYFPLLVEGKNQNKLTAGRRLPYRAPRNMNNNMAMGLSKAGYTTDLPTLAKHLGTSLRASGKANLLKVIASEGWSASEPRNWDGMFMGPDGVAYKGVREESAASRTVIVNGKPISSKGSNVVMPLFLNEGLKMVLAREPANDEDVVKALRWLNLLSTKFLPFELAFHSNGLFGVLYGNTPFVTGDTAMEKVLTAPILKSFYIRYKMATTDPSTPENSKKLIRIAKIGALPARSHTVTYSKEVAESTGAKREVLSWGPMLFGPKGIDARARIMMYDLAISVMPDISDEDLGDFINQIGQYTPEFQGEIERWLKRVQMGPFATAGMTRIVNGAHAAFGAGPVPPRGSQAWQIADIVARSAVMALGLYLLAYKLMTGKWPNKDPRFKMWRVPVGGDNHGWIDQYRHTAAGDLAWGKGPEVGYINLGSVVAPLIQRVTPRAAIERWLKNASPEQIKNGLESDVLNTLSHPALGPAARAAFVGVTGREPFITDFADRSGAGGPQLMPALPREIKPGFVGGLAPGLSSATPRRHTDFGGRVGAQTAATIKELSSTAAVIGQETGTLGQDEKRGSLMFRTVMDLAFPGVISNSSNPYAAKTVLQEQKRALAQH